MSERWILDLSASVYIDRDNITKGLPFEKKRTSELVRIYDNRAASTSAEETGQSV